MSYCKACCTVISLLVFYNLQSQFYFSSGNNLEPELLWEAGFSIGAMNCLTDIGGNSGTGKKFIKDINWNQTQFCGGLFVSASWQSRIALRLEATIGRIAGTDNVLKNQTDLSRARYLRNLHFRTTIAELALMSEWHLLSFISKQNDPSQLSPYLTAGAGFFQYNPQALIKNTWIDLRPLHTEGQGFKEYSGRNEYKTFNWCVPVGAGIKYDAGGTVTLRFEILYRITGTDYLDDVSTRYIDPSLFSKYLSSTAASLAASLADRSVELAGGFKNSNNDIRGNPGNKDAYFSCSLKISFPLQRLRRK